MFFLLYWYVFLIVTIFGTFGSILMFFVYMQPKFRKLSVSTYFCAMSVSNLVININAILQFLDNYFDINLFDNSEFTCKTLHFVIFLAGPLSAWFLVAAGIDRYLSIFYPGRFAIIKKSRFSLAAVLAILTLNIAIYFHLFLNLYLSKTFRQSSQMTHAYCDGNLGTKFSIIDLFNSTVLPFILMIGTSVVTVNGIVKSRHRMRKSFNLEAQRRIQLRDIKYGVTVIVLNITFLILNAPHPVIVLMSTEIKHFSIFNSQITFILELLFYFLYYLFYSITFYEQIAINSTVRKEFFKSLRKLGMICIHFFRLFNLSDSRF